jgi:hypothetical protein
LIRSDRTFISYSKDTFIQSLFDIYKYDQLNRLVDFSTFENDDTIKLSARDSICYNTNNQVSTRYIFFYRRDTSRLESIHTYGYDLNGNVSEIKIIHLDTAVAGTIIKYDWQNGNNIRKKTYKLNEELQETEEYTYDDHPNYRLGIPVFGEQKFQGKNNLMSTTRTFSSDTTRSLGCILCNVEYTYGKNGYPIKYIYNRTTVELSYKPGSPPSVK